MKSTVRPSYPRLSTAERHLLSAATQTRTIAQAAWDAWRPGHRIETAEPKAQALFGMVYANLLADLGGPDSTLLKGVYRQTWYTNQLALHQLRSLLDRLAAHDVTALVLNDASIVAGYYPDIGCRVIRCIDILVHGEHWDRSIAAASEEGWQAERSKSFGSRGSLSAMAFAGPESRSMRIWTNLFTAAPQEDTDARIWGEARSIRINDHSIPTLGPVEQLLFLSADAFREKEPPLFLYADARLLLQSLSSAADWARLVWQAQRFEHILPLRNMLAVLQETLSVILPEWVLPALHKMAISHAELLQYHQACESPQLRLKSRCLRWLIPFLPEEVRPPSP
jgi:hypothetical protein